MPQLVQLLGVHGLLSEVDATEALHRVGKFAATSLLRKRTTQPRILEQPCMKLLDFARRELNFILNFQSTKIGATFQ